MTKLTFLYVFSLFAVQFGYSQRKITTESKGADVNYLPVSVSGTPDCNYFNSGLVLTFNDEFNTNVLDTSKWNPCYPWGIANSDSSDSWCDLNEILFTGNTLKLGVNARSKSNIQLNNQTVTRDYAIGVISTKQKFDYGYYEIRCKIPRVAELWPAFWMHGDCGQEIDIFEFSDGSYKSSKKKMFHDRLSPCSPHRSRWYIPQECATANPYMTCHSPIKEGVCANQLGERRTIGSYLEYSTWNVKKTPFNFNKGCVYDNIKVDIDFHNEWHTFGMAFTPESITWYIDSIPQISEYRYFKKIPNTSGNSILKDEYIPTCLSSYCSGTLNAELYEQVNLPQGNNKMSVILNNNHRSRPDYNLIKWVDSQVNWPDGYFEIDYFRYYKFTSHNSDISFCKKNRESNSFYVFPNPSDGNITIQAENSILPKHIKLINNLGMILFQDTFETKEHKMTVTAPTGIYFIQFTCNGETVYKKIILIDR